MPESAEFTAAAAQVKNLKTSPNNDELLELYALFKQGSIGDVNTDRPGLFDLKGKAKWDAWSKKKGIASDEAQRLYVEYVNRLVEQYGLN